MKFQPKTEADLKKDRDERLGLWDRGIYPFEVKRAADEKSKAGNDMIHLELKIFNLDGRIKLLEDWLLEAMPGKLFNFCCHAKIEAKYHAGTLTAQDCENKSGYLQVGIEKGKPKGDGTNFDDRNKIMDYVAAPAGAATKAPAASAKKPDDDVAF